MTENGENMARKIIALTFDDGPNTSTTAEILDVLEKYGVVATFFVCGCNIDEESSAVMKRAFDMGCEIGNHSFSHTAMPSMSRNEIIAEIEETDKRVLNVTGVYPAFFRPPYIAVSDEVFSTVKMPFICGFGCDDWNPCIGTGERIEKILSQAENGAIILLHDMTGNAQTVEAVDKVIPMLAKLGFDFVTVSSLFERAGVIPQQNATIYSSAFAGAE